MELLRRVLLSLRLIALGLAVLVTPAALRAEQIRFSKPAKEIAAPAQLNEDLPEAQSKRVDFGGPTIAAPLMQQQTIIHIQPREEDEDDRFSPRRSRRLTDPRRESKSASGQNSVGSQSRFPGEFWRGEPLGLGRSEMQRALSPVMDFEWDARESSIDQDNSSRENGSLSERTPDRKRIPSARETYGVQNEILPSSPFSDLSASRPKEKPGRDLLDRRAAFEQMLNPAAGLAGRPPGSLEPDLAGGVAKSAPSLAMPATRMGTLNARSADPMQAFNVRARTTEPMLEDIGNKYLPRSVKASSVTSDSRLQTPLNRQPTSRDLPGRKF